VRLYTDGSRRVLLRRKKSRVHSQRPTSRNCEVLRLAAPVAVFGAAERIHTLVFALLRGFTAFALRAVCCTGSSPGRSGAGQHGVRHSFSRPARLAAGFDKDGVDCSPGVRWVSGTQRSEPSPHIRSPATRAADVPAAADRPAEPDGVQQPRRRRAGSPARAAPADVPIGVNIGKTKTARSPTPSTTTAPAPAWSVRWRRIWWSMSARRIRGPARSAAVESLRPILSAVLAEAADTPVLVKIAPDLSDADTDEIADLAVELGWPALWRPTPRCPATACLHRGRRTGCRRHLWSTGGAAAAEVLRRLYGRVGGRLVLISVGGIETPMTRGIASPPGVTVAGYTASSTRGMWRSTFTTASPVACMRAVRLTQRRRRVGGPKPGESPG